MYVIMTSCLPTEEEMHRTQIQLPDDQARALKDLAARRNQSIASLIREAVDEWLRGAGSVDPHERKRRAIAAAGRFRSGHRDVSVEHDRHLSEAFEDDDVR
jgi:predicted transcriptional regulator